MCGLGVRWAREKIAGLEREMRRDGDPDSREQEITQLALDHHLVSRYTSLVAVDKTPIRPAGKHAETRRLPSQAPAGSQMSNQTVSMAQGSTPSLILLIVGMLMSLLGAALAGGGRLLRA